MDSSLIDKKLWRINFQNPTVDSNDNDEHFIIFQVKESKNAQKTATHSSNKATKLSLEFTTQE